MSRPRGMKRHEPTLLLSAVLGVRQAKPYRTWRNRGPLRTSVLTRQAWASRESESLGRRGWRDGDRMVLCHAKKCCVWRG